VARRTVPVIHIIFPAGHRETTHNDSRLSYITCSIFTQQVVNAKLCGNHQRESAHLPTTTDASGKRPTVN